ncbi:MAG: DUF1080 domain-containing protein [Phycisphaerales bacterium]|nr:DUF1080 domain-containing protein [Phycisphaerales bacterium]
MKRLVMLATPVVMLGLFAAVLCRAEKADTVNTKYSTAPKGALVLFDGTGLDQWVNCHGDKPHWKLIDGAMEVTALKGHKCPRIQGIKTSKLFSDFQLHVEFNLPEGEKVNSGVYLLRRYEIQIVNSAGKPVGKSNCGELYKQKPPDRDMCSAPGKWQSYDIVFRSPRFEKDADGKNRKVEDARITVIHNGVVIHNNVIVKSKTGAGFEESPEPGAIMLQDHGSKVRFRNIWIVPGKPALAPDYKAK